MAIKINVELKRAGIIIPTSSMVKPNIHFPSDIIEKNDKKETTKIRRFVSFDNILFSSKEAYNENPTESIGYVDNFDSGHTKELTDSEFNELSGDGNALLIVEGWVKEYLESKLGAGTCEIISAY